MIGGRAIDGVPALIAAFPFPHLIELLWVEPSEAFSARSSIEILTSG